MPVAAYCYWVPGGMVQHIYWYMVLGTTMVVRYLTGDKLWKVWSRHILASKLAVLMW